MVRIAIAGASSEIGRELLEALNATEKHDIIILSRNDVSQQANSPPGVSWRKVDYTKQDELLYALKGVHTVLSFIAFSVEVQKSLIDASIIAGVKRFAPSEFASSSIEEIPWYHGRGVIREYLKEVNKDKKVLEYTLFQTGLFCDYLAYPHNTTKHMTPLNTNFDLENMRALVVDDVDVTITLTTAEDVAGVVARAVEYEGEWPVIGGISGNRVTFSQILDIGARVRGTPFSVDRVGLKDLEAGELKVTWPLEVTGPSFLKARFPNASKEELTTQLHGILVNLLLSSAQGAWTVSDEWNKLLPDYQFTKLEGFLRKVWGEQS